MTDKEIIELYFARDERAIAETDRRYGGYLRETAWNLLHSREDGEEVVQDTYMKTWASVPPTRPRVLRHYLSGIARNLAINRLRYRGAAKRDGELTVLLSELDECIPERRSAVEEHLEAGALKAVLDRFLGTCRREDSALFLARYYYGLSVRDLAKRFALSERKVTYRLHRLREALREELQKEGFSV